MNSVTATLVNDLGSHNWALCKDFLAPDMVASLRNEALQLWEQGAFAAAGIGRGAGRHPEIRGDQVLWLDAALTPVAQRFVQQELEALRLAINQATYLGLHEFEGHFAVYPSGSHYARHLDQFRQGGERLVSLVLYLNKGWEHGDGGELCLYMDDSQSPATVTIEPRAGSLVCFLSERIPHEVKPARRERLSLTGWFRRRAL